MSFNPCTLTQNLCLACNSFHYRYYYCQIALSSQTESISSSFRDSPLPHRNLSSEELHCSQKYEFSCRWVKLTFQDRENLAKELATYRLEFISAECYTASSNTRQEAVIQGKRGVRTVHTRQSRCFCCIAEFTRIASRLSLPWVWIPGVCRSCKRQHVQGCTCKRPRHRLLCQRSG
ncbi:hypothetical protein PoB_003275900 [Plakobranchus ocellatus]|uniref:Uncharacterized protein n=1 Tax=Plakobranchus ocellatus TaxID=259542 RepID=A0AAV4AJ24_9GAST|nr:hypothetical protein PoB_003275900 [Plakobranchus ocellatus]